MGAVLLGLDPSIICERCIKRTYGVAMAGLALPTDPPGEVFNFQGNKLVRGLFKELVTKGSLVSTTQAVTCTFGQDHPGADLPLELYAYDTPTPPRFVSAAGVQKLKALVIPGNLCPEFGKTGVKVLLDFGKTEFELRAIDVRTGKSTNTITFTD